MALVNMSDMLADAYERRYAVPSFDLLNLDIIRPVIETAVEENAPVIIAALKRGLESTGIKPFASVVRSWAEQVDIPVVLHLDHGDSVEIVSQCIDAGFTSVMIDGSHMPIDGNIALTREVVELAKPQGVTVEGEIGRVPGIEGGKVVAAEEETFAEVEETVRLCEETGIDAVAPSIGTVHFFQTKLLDPDMDLLKELRARLKTPLVLHGGASVTDAKAAEMVACGITKYNINFKVNFPFFDGLRTALSEMNEEVRPGRFSISPPALIAAGQEPVKDLVRSYLRLLGTCGKA